MPCALYAPRPILPLTVATIGENLRRLRSKVGIQQGELADRVGVPQSQVSRWETDFAIPDTGSLLKIAPALGATIDDIVEGVHAPYDLVVKRRSETALQQPEPLRTAVDLETALGPREFVQVPLMDGRIAAGPPLVIRDLEVLDYLAFPPTLLDQLGVRPSAAKCVRVGPREMSMFATIKPNDIVLLDCSDAKRDHPTPGRIYAVNVEDGSTLKRITLGTDGLSLHSDNLDKGTYPMRTIAFDDDTLMRNIIVGEAVWAGGALL